MKSKADKILKVTAVQIVMAVLKMTAILTVASTLAMAVVAANLVGCRAIGQPTESTSMATTSTTIGTSMATTSATVGTSMATTGAAEIQQPAFSAQYVRTNGYHNGRAYPIVTVVRSTAELAAYYEKYRGDYDLQRRQNPASDYTMGFLDAIDRYGEEYFSKNLLIVLILEEPSGSNRHKVTGITAGSLSLDIAVERQIPGIGTADMAEWHVLIEMKKSDDASQNIRVSFTVKKT
jgi:hypothetical protein